MLYQPKSRISLIAKHVIGSLGAVVAGLVGARSDRAYLDGMRSSELEDLGLRRSDDGDYRFFK